MWNDILGALSIVAVIMVGVVAVPAMPKLVDAVCDRIRGTGAAAGDDAGPAAEEGETPAAKPASAVRKPAAAAKPAAKPASAVRDAA